MTEDFRLPVGEIVDKRWKLQKLLGAGAFGAVYEVVDLKDDKKKVYALKLERNDPNDSSMNLLKLEVTVLRFLRASGAKHCPGYISCGQNPKFNYVVMGLVGKSLSDARKQMPGKKFTLRTTLHIGMESVTSIEEIHAVGFIHRDFKPANLAIGRPPDDLRRIYLLDWGLCRRYLNKQGEVLPQREKAPFRGTPRYASHNALAAKEQGRLDDMWSWLFTLVDLTTGELPWDEGEPDDSDEQMEWLKVEKAKAVKDITKLLKGCPDEYKLLHKMFSDLGYADKPDYSKCIRVLKRTLRKKKFTDKTPLDWEPLANTSKLLTNVPNASMLSMSKPKKGDSSMSEG